MAEARTELDGWPGCVRCRCQALIDSGATGDLAADCLAVLLEGAPHTCRAAALPASADANAAWADSWG